MKKEVMAAEVCQQCGDWELEQWLQFYQHAWHEMDRKGKGFAYELPHMVKDPCDGCVCADWCVVPCSQRLQWWDRCMACLRRRMYGPVES